MSAGGRGGGAGDGRIYVGNLPADVREKDLEELFYKYGRIRDIELKSKRGLVPFAFVRFEDPRPKAGACVKVLFKVMKLGVSLQSLKVTMSDRKAVIKNADMSEEMQQDSVECATQALEKYNIEKDIAAHIKKEFDKKYNPTWHCIVGRNFGSYVTHETKHFIYFYLGQVAILLFKSG
ncbi:Dynein light chain 1, cytoplasmic [Varanus komodoensis]|nr:Dynein light chain 1, cytoplasmic [Varanus komodoensis]